MLTQEMRILPLPAHWGLILIPSQIACFLIAIFQFSEYPALFMVALCVSLLRNLTLFRLNSVYSTDKNTYTEDYLLKVPVLFVATLLLASTYTLQLAYVSPADSVLGLVVFLLEVSTSVTTLVVCNKCRRQLDILIITEGFNHASHSFVEFLDEVEHLAVLTLLVPGAILIFSGTLYHSVGTALDLVTPHIVVM